MPQFPIQPPVGGVNRVVAREGQPPNTCWDAVNILPYDRYGRHRISQRHGLVKEYPAQLGTTKIQGMIAVNNITYAGTTSSTINTILNTFGAVPATVSTFLNSIAYPAHFTSAGTDTGPIAGSSAPLSIGGDGWTLSFNVNYTSTSLGTAGDTCFVWVELGTASTQTFTQLSANSTAILGGYFNFSPNPGIGGYLELRSSTTNNVAYTGQSFATPPGTNIPCSITWSSSGIASATIAGNTTNFNYTGPNTGTLGPITPNATMFIKFFSQTIDANQQININNIVLTTGTAVSTGQTGYTTKLVVVEGGYVWVGDAAGNIVKAANGQATPKISSTGYVSMAVAGNGSAGAEVFIADGSSTLWNYTLSTDTVASTAPVASPGNVTGTVPPNCNLVCNWRGRIVLAGDSLNPQQWYMSRPAGTYFNTVTSTNVFIGPGVDWDYSQTDPAAAISGQQARSGLIGEPVTALIPFSDDYLKFGCAHSLWMAQGDPADGGSIVQVSQNIGIVGKDAWVIDPAGTLWFVATGGLYSCRPAWEFYRPPEPVTLFSVDSNFTQLDPGVARTTLVFDPDLHYLHIFMSAPPLSGTLGQHLTMDARSVGGDQPPAFWPQTFPSTMGPTCAISFLADANPNNRTTLIGGNDGFIRAWKPAATDDDGTAISAGITFGPYALAGPGQAAIVQGLTIDMGETPVGFNSTQWGAIAKLSAGPDAYSVTEYLGSGLSPKPISIISLSLDRRQKTFRQRMRGGWFSLNLTSQTDNSFFSFEGATIDFVPAGKNRERRQ